MLPDEVAEWLRRWTANPLGSPRVGSNPILVECGVFLNRMSSHAHLKASKRQCIHVSPSFPTGSPTKGILGFKQGFFHE